eukprot:TRINITY_DN2158_c0_g1_i2.p1 TRINITY_DN2158_c0_g1~~TRINITY_DN2158_c0_g1_i2.p1  ORF type:complete len:392 (+),score=93.31 TRINITY_DN2158_c0_g1_i2:156-1178(+)
MTEEGTEEIETTEETEMIEEETETTEVTETEELSEVTGTEELTEETEDTEVTGMTEMTETGVTGDRGVERSDRDRGVDRGNRGYRGDRNDRNDRNRGDRNDRGGDRGGYRGGDRNDRDRGDRRQIRSSPSPERKPRVSYSRPKDEPAGESNFANIPMVAKDEPIPESQIKWGKADQEESEEEIEKEKPDYKPSGLLTKDLKTRKGVELVYTECEDGRIPVTKWRLYPMKDNAVIEPYKIHKKSYYLLGRDRKVVDIPLDHPSCSKQHAVIQFRMISREDPDTLTMKRVNKPYIMDLGSTNKTMLNGTPIDSERYVELFERDVIKFGNSSREYVLLHEGSQ